MDATCLTTLSPTSSVKPSRSHFYRVSKHMYPASQALQLIASTLNLVAALLSSKIYCNFLSWISRSICRPRPYISQNLHQETARSPSEICTPTRWTESYRFHVCWGCGSQLRIVASWRCCMLRKHFSGTFHSYGAARLEHARSGRCGAWSALF